MKILVLGKGISGLCLAYYLSKFDHDITIYGKEGSSNRASSWAQGIVCNKGLVNCQSPLFHYKLKSLTFIKSFLNELESLGYRIDMNFEDVVELYNEEFNSVFKRIYKGNFQGLFRNINKPFSKDLPLKRHLGIMSYPSEGWFHVEQFLAALESILKDKYHQKFISKHLSLEEIKDIKGDFDLVVCAAGWGAVDIIDHFIESGPKLRAVSGQTLKYKCEEKQSLNIVKGTKSIIWNSNEIFVGSTSIKSDKPTLEELNNESAKLEEFVSETIDNSVKLEQLKNESYGVRVLTKSRTPMWGYSSDKKFLFITGMYKNGLQIAPILSKEIADSIEYGSDFLDFRYDL